MMQDYIRTSTYQRAMLDNSTDFTDKVRHMIASKLLTPNSHRVRWRIRTTLRTSDFLFRLPAVKGSVWVVDVSGL